MARRGFKFTVVEIEHLLETIEDIIPIGNPDWERIWQEHSARYPTKGRTSESLKRKFQQLARTKIPTGDPNCPPYVRDAKRIYYKIVQATDGSTGGSDVDDDHLRPHESHQITIEITTTRRADLHFRI